MRITTLHSNKAFRDFISGKTTLQQFRAAKHGYTTKPLKARKYKPLQVLRREVSDSRRHPVLLAILLLVCIHVIVLMGFAIKDEIAGTEPCPFHDNFATATQAGLSSAVEPVLECRHEGPVITPYRTCEPCSCAPMWATSYSLTTWMQ